MDLTHLLETSVLARLNDPAVRNAITELKNDEKGLARASISDLEIGFSARNASEWDELLVGVEAFELLEINVGHLRRAKQVQRLLAAKHQRGRKIPDLLIAAAAEATNLSLLHYDADFDLIAAVTGQSCEWIVPKGSIN
jgi:predicted nucleic acid-binding protein